MRWIDVQLTQNTKRNKKRSSIEWSIIPCKALILFIQKTSLSSSSYIWLTFFFPFTAHSHPLHLLIWKFSTSSSFILCCYYYYKLSLAYWFWWKATSGVHKCFIDVLVNEHNNSFLKSISFLHAISWRGNMSWKTNSLEISKWLMRVRPNFSFLSRLFFWLKIRNGWMNVGNRKSFHF
jgi:hypothetical protein